jgi:hypothetical protein
MSDTVFEKKFTRRRGGAEGKKGVLYENLFSPSLFVL